jgi:hypothetical protein
MELFEKMSAGHITLTDGRPIQFNDLLSTGAKFCPELRHEWILADMKKTDATGKALIAMKKVDALTAIVNLLSRR